MDIQTTAEDSGDDADSSNSLMPQALPVDETVDLSNVDMNQPATNAQEYLARVRKEAKALPDIIRAPTTIAVASKPKSVAPAYENASVNGTISLEWKAKFVVHFKGLREQLLYLKNKGSLNKWKDMPFDELKDNNKKTKQDQWLELIESQKVLPKLSIVLKLDTVTLIHISTALMQECSSDISEQKLSSYTCAWLYAILLLVEQPFLSDWISDLRIFGRELAQLRNDILKAQKFDNIQTVVALSTANMFLCIIEDIFKQPLFL
ncbi:hypothetical protein RFI_13969 [Reticulomyxa filosa]|uniref:Gem-associated protein 2 n=1 Tax=Reticulomyxa filosa TaxID=46433 RepID=X6NB10_RETFI|nr:hypothetical protein RFI_13969 [Reticulomyxa filosa]|eukprot:ETO23216.1 hypothetical protein RFI_13969 [Reticulomyxa filosa]